MLGTWKSAPIPGPPPPRAGSRPDSPPQVARLPASGPVSASASQPPCRLEPPHSGQISNTSPRSNFDFPHRWWGCKFARHTDNNYRVYSGTVHQNAQDFTSRQATRYGSATVRVEFGFGSISGGLIRCPRWRFIMKRHKLAANFGYS
jgi:hypothetical protein